MISATQFSLQWSVRNRPIPLPRTTPVAPYILFIHAEIGSLKVAVTILGRTMQIGRSSLYFNTTFSPSALLNIYVFGHLPRNLYYKKYLQFIIIIQRIKIYSFY